MIDSLLDWLACEGGILWIIGLIITSIVFIAIAFGFTHECVRYETKVVDKFPSYIKIGIALVPIYNGHKEITTCAEWKKK
jgi:hypothetical protein